jgi:hypothetical protein
MARFGSIAKIAVSSANVAIKMSGEGGWKVGGVEEVKERTKRTTLRDFCMNWE